MLSSKKRDVASVNTPNCIAWRSNYVRRLLGKRGAQAERNKQVGDYGRRQIAEQSLVRNSDRLTTTLGTRSPNALASTISHLRWDRAIEALTAVFDAGVIGIRWTDCREAQVIAVPSGEVRWVGVSGR